MNKEEIDKWLDNEYGVSYTSLEEIHDWLVDENIKKDKEIERLNNIINEFDKWLDLALEVFDNVDVKTLMQVKRRFKELKGDSSNDK